MRLAVASLLPGVPHYRLLLTRLLFRVSLFPHLLFSSVSELKLPAISQRYTYTAEAFFQESLLPSVFFYEGIFLSKVNSFFFGGSFCGNLFLFSPPSCLPRSLTHSHSFSFFSAFCDISTAIKETKDHYRYRQCRYLLCSACVLDIKLFPTDLSVAKNLFEVILLRFRVE